MHVIFVYVNIVQVFSITIVLVIEEMVQSPMAEYCCWFLVGLFFFGSILMSKWAYLQEMNRWNQCEIGPVLLLHVW